jgi:hypothetical protein
LSVAKTVRKSKKQVQPVPIHNRILIKKTPNMHQPHALWNMLICQKYQVRGMVPKMALPNKIWTDEKQD